MDQFAYAVSFNIKMIEVWLESIFGGDEMALKRINMDFCPQDQAHRCCRYTNKQHDIRETQGMQREAYSLKANISETF